jgi:hypothetical protein
MHGSASALGPLSLNPVQLLINLLGQTDNHP